jgi:hypothetical protein
MGVQKVPYEVTLALTPGHHFTPRTEMRHVEHPLYRRPHRRWAQITFPPPATVPASTVCPAHCAYPRSQAEISSHGPSPGT